jgi:hypothetical protein
MASTLGAVLGDGKKLVGRFIAGKPKIVAGANNLIPA